MGQQEAPHSEAGAMTYSGDNRGKGYTTLELIVVLAIIGAMTTTAIPQYAGYKQRAKAVSCQSNRRYIQMAELNHYMDRKEPKLEIDPKWRCSGGGTYVWLVSDPDALGYPKIGCSIHFAELPLPLVEEKAGLSQIEGLVAGFSMEEGSGSTLSAGEGAAEINGARWVEGKTGWALAFDGKDDYAQMDGDDWSGPFTIVTWVKVKPGKHDQYDSLFASSAKGPKKNNFQIDADGKGNYRFHGGSNNSRVDIGQISSDWQMIAVSFDGTHIRTYNNGNPVDTGTWKGTGEFTHYVLGRNRNRNKAFGGVINELGVYDRTVSAEEIQAYYEKTR